MYIRVGLAILLITIFVFGGIGTITEYTQYLGGDNIIKLDSFQLDGEEDDLHYRRLSQDDPKHYVFTTDIAEDEFSGLDTPAYMLVVHRLAGNWYKVYFNDILVGSLGNLVDSNSNIWNALTTFSIDPNAVEENNTLRLEVYGEHEIGGSSIPLLITDSVTAARLDNLSQMLHSNMSLLVIGVVLAICLLVFFLYGLAFSLELEYVFYGLASLLVCITLTDYLVITALPVPLITFKKIVVVAMYGAISSVSLGLYYHFREKINLVTGIVTIGSILLAAIVSRDLITFRAWFTNLNVLFAVNAVTWLYATFRNREALEAKVLFGATIVVLVLGGFDLFSHLQGINPLVNALPYAALVFSFAVIALLVLHYIRVQQTILYHNQRAQLFFEQAVTDMMTGLYNHQFVVNTLEGLNVPYSLVMLDIDDFKEVNDQYGHMVGDEVIKYVARTAKRVVRTSDVVGRYGGDEFLIVLLNCGEEQSIAVAEKIKSAVEDKPYLTDDGEEVSVTLSIGVYTPEPGETADSALYKVDTALYGAKNRGKCQICPFTELERQRAEVFRSVQ